MTRLSWYASSTAVPGKDLLAGPQQQLELVRRGSPPSVLQGRWDLRPFLLMTCNVQGNEGSALAVSTRLTRLELLQHPHSSFILAFPSVLSPFSQSIKDEAEAFFGRWWTPLPGGLSLRKDAVGQ